MRGGAREEEQERKAKADTHSESEGTSGTPPEYRCDGSSARVPAHEDVTDH